MSAVKRPFGSPYSPQSDVSGSSPKRKASDHSDHKVGRTARAVLFSGFGQEEEKTAQFNSPMSIQSAFSSFGTPFTLSSEPQSHPSPMQLPLQQARSNEVANNQGWEPPKLRQPIHFELEEAITKIAKKRPPGKPVSSLLKNLQQEYRQLPLIQSANAMRENVENNRLFLLNLPDRQVTIHNVTPIGSGQHSDVYLCDHRSGQLVLKVFKSSVLESNPKLIVECAAGQLYRYAQNKSHPFMKDHTAMHFNFDPHVKEVSKWFETHSAKQLKAALQDYVQKQVNLGYIVSEYIPEDFPVLDCDIKKHAGEAYVVDPNYQQQKCWMQLKEMFVAKTIDNDTRRSNVRIGQDGEAYLVDMFERFDRFAIDKKELRRSFSSIEDVQDWICPLTDVDDCGWDSDDSF